MISLTSFSYCETNRLINLHAIASLKLCLITVSELVWYSSNAFKYFELYMSFYFSSYSLSSFKSSTSFSALIDFCCSILTYSPSVLFMKVNSSSLLLEFFILSVSSSILSFYLLLSTLNLSHSFVLSRNICFITLSSLLISSTFSLWVLISYCNLIFSLVMNFIYSFNSLISFKFS